MKMNKKAAVEGATIFIVASIIIFILSLATGFKIFSIIQDLPAAVWWIIIAIVIYSIFKGKK